MVAACDLRWVHGPVSAVATGRTNAPPKLARFFSCHAARIMAQLVRVCRCLWVRKVSPVRAGGLDESFARSGVPTPGGVRGRTIIEDRTRVII